MIYNNKKGLISLTVFSILLILMFMILGISYLVSEDAKKEALEKNTILEIQNSILSFRSNILNIVSKDNSTYVYRNDRDIVDIKITLEEYTISGSKILDHKIIIVNESSLGIKFCSTYEISGLFNSTFYFNGSCVSKTS